MYASVLYLFICCLGLPNYSSSLTAYNLNPKSTGSFFALTPYESRIANSRGFNNVVNFGGKYLCYSYVCILAIILLYLLLKCEPIIPFDSSNMCYCIVDIRRLRSLL